MSPSSSSPGSAQETYASQERVDAVRAAVDCVVPFLPDQPPLSVFLALNTLAAFQHLPFHEAVAQASELLGGEPYLSEERFRAHLAAGRIDDDDLNEALAHGFDDQHAEVFVESVLDERGLRKLLLVHAISEETESSLDWLLRERRMAQRLRDDVPADARSRLLDRSLSWLSLKLEASSDIGPFVDALVPQHIQGDRARVLADELEVEVSRAALATAMRERGEAFSVAALWAACVDLAESLPAVRGGLATRAVPLHRDLVRATAGEDVFDHVFPVLIRTSAAYLDDGLAQRSMPDRQLGFYRCVRNLVADGSRLPLRWLSAARRDFAAQRARGDTAESTIIRALSRLGVPEADNAEYLLRLLLTLPGWAGMMSRLERHPEDRGGSDARPTLIDFLAVRLTYELAALTTFTGFDDDALAELYAAARADSTVGTALRGARSVAYTLLQVFQITGVSAGEVRSLSRERVTLLIKTLDGFGTLSRRRVFQEAFERHYRVQTLAALAAHRAARVAAGSARPRCQFITCFDDRAESFRRHIEELEPAAETFGVPGFFGAAMRFRGLDQRSHVPLAPVLFEPEHQVEELPSREDLHVHTRRARRRSLIAQISERLRLGTRSLFRGILLNVTLGLLAAFPLVLRVVSPRAAGGLRSFVARVFLPAPRTELTLHREGARDGPKRGFNVDERVARVATVLENIGLTRNQARIVVLLGHGATTLNNPHASAYQCGACGGRKGGPNARVVAHMANDPEVRAGLRQLGIALPDDTIFVGGQHDTCSEDVLFFDVPRIPASHRADFEAVQALIRKAGARDAHERCRRMVPFSAPTSPSAFEALRHVQTRSEHLAEPRPELSHQTNAVAVIGRRALTRGLFLDRRAFLLSYDPAIDPTGSILARALAAAAPVAAGINLQYYFSAVDPERYGAGSKLPHNVVGLIGVMTGHASDLRTGLPRQMVEIHEPQRLLLVVEATPATLLEITRNDRELRELITNHWVHVVTLDPADGAMHTLSERGFEPYQPHALSLPTAESSRTFYRGKHGPLSPARIVATTTHAA